MHGVDAKLEKRWAVSSKYLPQLSRNLTSQGDVTSQGEAQDFVSMCEQEPLQKYVWYQGALTCIFHILSVCGGK